MRGVECPEAARFWGGGVSLAHHGVLCRQRHSAQRGDGGAHNPEFCRLGAGGERLLKQAMQRFGLSTRTHDHIRKVARTIENLAGEDVIGIEHLSQAVQYRTLDREVRY